MAIEKQRGSDEVMVESMVALATRRSVAVKDLHMPAPSDAELQQIWQVATRVPDHGKLAPWRLVILRDDGALNLGARAADMFARANPDATEAQIAAEHTRFARAPLCVAVLSTPVADSKPVWEQELSAGAVCMNILHAVHALGYGAKWLTEWVAYAPEILSALGGKPTDKIAGFIYIGSKTSEPEDRARPDVADVVRIYL